MTVVDIGREPGTWMDIRWGNSGQRVKASVAISLEPGGRITIIDKYPMGLMVCTIPHFKCQEINSSRLSCSDSKETCSGSCQIQLASGGLLKATSRRRSSNSRWNTVGLIVPQQDPMLISPRASFFSRFPPWAKPSHRRAGGSVLNK